MTYHSINPDTVRRAACDGPGCVLSELFESDDEAGVPNNWSRMGIGLGYRIFHSVPCANAWLLALSIEQRTGSGWTIHYTADTIGFPT